ncbi:MAG: nucleotide exchange factor GrpE [Chloroflexi bacterium RBG_16_48_7]|nr:MAG: nucleotide exchange factor GrpE [Chloroflexi bacterium RBG_16_48_7]
MKEDDGAMTSNNHESINSGAEPADIEGLNKSLAEEKEKAEKNLDNWRRAEADFSNYRKRSEQEKADIAHNTTCSVILAMLPVFDDFERALASVPEESAKLPWLEGMNLIYKKIRGTLESLGVEELCALGQPFEPSLHEALAQVDGKEGEVVAELQKGYKIKGKLLRPSKVLVGKGNGQ